MKLKLCIVSLYLSASSAFMPNSLLQTNRPKLHSSILSAKAKAGSSEEGSKEDKNKTDNDDEDENDDNVCYSEGVAMTVHHCLIYVVKN